MTEGLVCTIATKKYLPLARALALSVKRHNPGLRVLVLLADHVDGFFRPEAEPFSIITLDELGQPEMIRRMAFYYTAPEFCFALKAFLHGYVLRKTETERWLYLDSDMLVCHSLAPLLQALSGASVLLTPHRATPAPQRFVSSEINILSHGIYNGGLQGFRRSVQCAKFIEWFEERLTLNALVELPGMYSDQLWLNFAPLYFEGVATFDDPAANFGHWNADLCSLGRDSSGQFTVNGRPLLISHFSGWDINHPHRFSARAPAQSFEEGPIWRQLADEYRAGLLENGYDEAQKWPYAFAAFDDGVRISSKLRRRYWADVMASVLKGTEPDPPPFAAGREFRRRSKRLAVRQTMSRCRAALRELVSRSRKLKQ